MQSTMMDVPLSLNHLLERAGDAVRAATRSSRACPTSRCARTATASSTGARARSRRRCRSSACSKGDRVATLCWNHHAHLECYFGIPAAGGVMHTLNLRLVARRDRLDRRATPRTASSSSTTSCCRSIAQFAAQARVREGDRVPVLGRAGRPAAFTRLRSAARRRRRRRLRLRAARRERSDRHVLHVGHDGPAEGRRLLASLDGAAHAGRLPRRLLGPARRPTSLLPVTPMFHANSWGMPYAAVMLGVKHRLPRPAPASRRPARPDAARAADARARRADDLDGPDPGLRAARSPSSPGAGSCRAGMRSLVGGAAVPEALIRAFAKHGVWIIQGWGMTETSPLATDLVPARRAAGRRATTSASGAPRWPACRCRWSTCASAATTASDAPWDGKSVGEIQVRGPVHHRLVPRGAGRAEDKFTADGWLRTGDVATMDELGFVRITDRTKDLIKSGGEWISSVDLENALMAHPGDRRSGGDRDPRREVERAAARLRRAASRAQRWRRRIADELERAPARSTASPSGSCPTATR